MPKNPYQRPQKVFQSHGVPRHGAPIPVKKPQEKKVLQPRTEAPLPPLEALLSKLPKDH